MSEPNLTSPSENRDPRLPLRLGALFLLIAAVWRWAIRPSGALPQNLADGALGLFYGLSIAFFVVSMHRRRKRRWTP